MFKQTIGLSFLPTKPDMCRPGSWESIVTHGQHMLVLLVAAVASAVSLRSIEVPNVLAEKSIRSMAEKSSISTWVMGLSKNAVYPFKWSLNRAH